jgi:hypothetical protein
MTPQPTLAQAEAVRDRLARLLHDVELAFPENGAGTYPSEVEMTLRLAYTTAARAARQLREEQPA